MLNYKLYFIIIDILNYIFWLIETQFCSILHFFVLLLNLVMHQHVSLSPSSGVFRCCSPGGQLLH